MVREGQFRVMTMDNVKSFHVMYVLRTYIVIHICFGFNSVFVCGLCDSASLLPVLSAQLVPLDPMTDNSLP